MEPLERAEQLFEAFDDELRLEIPPGADLYDAHTHLGHDIDVMVGQYDELIAMLYRHGVSRAPVFCLDEHDRVPAFRAGNDRPLEFAARSERRLVPFVRL